MAETPLVAVLAAGLGKRFGGGKLEAFCAGRPLGRWVLDAVAAAGLEPGVVVAGSEGVSFAAEWTQRINPRPESGLGSSLALAAREAQERGAQALVVLLADMPLVTPAYLRELVSLPAPAATHHPDGRPGVPVVLDGPLINAAAQLSGDRGAGPLLAGARLLEPPPEMLADVDTPEDLAQVARMLVRPAPSPARPRA